MSLRPVQAALVCALALPPALAQRAAPGTLARALAIWSAADVDRDGKITRSESATIPIDVDGFRKADADADGVWSREEFLLFYRRFVVASSEPVGADLDAEILRLCVLKKARAAAEARPPTASAREPAIAAAFAELELRLVERRAEPADVARLRNLLRAKLRPRPTPSARALHVVPATESDAILDRIERAIARGEDPLLDRASLRAFLVRRGWIAALPAQARLERRPK